MAKGYIAAKIADHTAKKNGSRSRFIVEHMEDRHGEAFLLMCQRDRISPDHATVLRLNRFGKEELYFIQLRNGKTFDALVAGVERWSNGEPIQSALPWLSPADHEFICDGTTSEYRRIMCDR